MIGTLALDEHLRAVAEELSASDPDAASDLREHSARITEAWENPESLGSLSAAAYAISKHAAQAQTILEAHGK
jgi:hypothetical protein